MLPSLSISRDTNFRYLRFFWALDVNLFVPLAFLKYYLRVKLLLAVPGKDGRNRRINCHGMDWLPLNFRKTFSFLPFAMWNNVQNFCAFFPGSCGLHSTHFTPTLLCILLSPACCISLNSPLCCIFHLCPKGELRVEISALA